MKRNGIKVLICLFIVFILTETTHAKQVKTTSSSATKNSKISSFTCKLEPYLKTTSEEKKEGKIEINKIASMQLVIEKSKYDLVFDDNAEFINIDLWEKSVFGPVYPFHDGEYLVKGYVNNNTFIAKSIESVKQGELAAGVYNKKSRFWAIQDGSDFVKTKKSTEYLKDKRFKAQIDNSIIKLKKEGYDSIQSFIAKFVSYDTEENRITIESIEANTRIGNIVYGPNVKLSFLTEPYKSLLKSQNNFNDGDVVEIYQACVTRSCNKIKTFVISKVSKVK